MGQNSVRREGTQPSVPHARERGWDDELHGAGEATGAGDSSVLTAFGVFQGMRASAQHLWGDPTLR
ncbi:hypothetical protein AB0O27_37575, partial [Streptomyces hydrogenans]